MAWKHDVIHGKPEEHITYRNAVRARGDGATATGNMHKNLVKFGLVVSSYAWRQTNRHTHHDSLHLSWGRGRSNSSVVNGRHWKVPLWWRNFGKSICPDHSSSTAAAYHPNAAYCKSLYHIRYLIIIDTVKSLYRQLIVFLTVTVPTISDVANSNRYLARAENVVYVLQKSFVLYFVVTENESDPLALATGCSIQKLEIFNEVRDVVWSNMEHQNVKH